MQKKVEHLHDFFSAISLSEPLNGVDFFHANFELKKITEPCAPPVTDICIPEKI